MKVKCGKYQLFMNNEYYQKKKKEYIQQCTSDCLSQQINSLVTTMSTLSVYKVPYVIVLIEQEHTNIYTMLQHILIEATCIVDYIHFALLLCQLITLPRTKSNANHLNVGVALPGVTEWHTGLCTWIYFLVQHLTLTLFSVCIHKISLTRHILLKYL